jgi:GxxExxY protein
MDVELIANKVVNSAIRIHQRLGPGLFESVYEAIFAYELKKQGFHSERQKAFPLQYDEMIFPEAFRVDLIVEGAVIVEIKSVAKLAPEAEKQILTYLRLLDLRLGLLLNFGMPLMKDGILRYANRL